MTTASSRSSSSSSSSSSRSSTQPDGYDVIAVFGFDKGFGAFSSTEFFIQFNNNTSIFKGIFKKEKSAGEMDNEDVGGGNRRTTSLTRPKALVVKCNDELCDSMPAVMVNDRLVFVGEDGVYTTSPSSRMLEQFGLRGGRNSVTFESREYQCEVTCHVWLWSVSDRLVVVDVDGTLTRSDVRGYVETVYLGVYDYIHTGVVDFLNNLVGMGAVMTTSEVERPVALVDSKDEYAASQKACVEPELELGRELASTLRVVYLTARPLRHLQQTKRFISSLRPSTSSSSQKGQQQHGDTAWGLGQSGALSDSDSLHFCLPSGPLFCNKVGQFQALYGEMTGTVADFKGQLLQDIETQFIRVGRRGESPWVLGIGNKDTDAKAYQMCNIRPENIFIIQKSSAIHCQVRVQQPQQQQQQQGETFSLGPDPDHEILDQLESHQLSPICPASSHAPQQLGRAIVENTLALFAGPSIGTGNSRAGRHGVDLDLEGSGLAENNKGVEPGFLPGDNGGLMIEGDVGLRMTAVAEMSSSAISYVSARVGATTMSYPVQLHVFTGYGDPVLLDYARHLLWQHHLASSSQQQQQHLVDRFLPFDFPRPSEDNSSQTCPAGGRARAWSLSDNDTDSNPTSGTVSSSVSSLLTEVNPSSGSTAGHTNLPRPPRLSRNISAPLPSSSLACPPLAPQPFSPVKPLRGGKGTSKGVKLSHMTDFFNSETFADV